jgi:hypothetical protein
MTAALHRWSKRLFSQEPFRKTKRQRLRRAPERPRLEQLETRFLPAGTWAAVTNLAPGPIGTMMLLPDGTVMAQNGDLSTPANRNQWYKLTPNASGSYAAGTWSNLASMNLQRLYYGSNVLPDGRVFVVGGEYSGSAGTQNWTNTGEIYNPVTNTWSNIANFPQTQFGDDPTQVLPDGRVLAGYLSAANTYIYNPATNSWSATGSKLRSDRSDEETWLKLPDDSILSYDVFTEGQGGTNHAQRYVPSSGTWVDAGNVPTALSGGNSFGFELGGAVRLPDGRVWFLGANSHTAFYTPSTNSWAAGPNIPNNASNQLQGADDAPMAMLPDGKVLLAVDHPVFNGPTNVYEFDPGASTFTNVTPSISGLNVGGACFTDRMLTLPNGQVLFTSGGNRLAVYTPAGTPSASWRSAVNIIRGAGTTLTLTGTQLNGISQGASYGDDAEMDTNYPIVQYRSIGSSNVSYARTANWSSTGVATGTTTVDFTLPSRGIYLLNAIANGIASPTILNVEMTSASDNLVIRNNPGNSANVQVVSGNTILAETSISSLSKIIVTCDNNTDTLAVSYQYGNPLPTNGLDFGFGAGVDTLNVNDTTTTTNQTFTLTGTSVQRSGSAPITFLSGGINFVNVNGGTGNNTYNITGTESGWATALNTGSGADNVNVNATGAFSTLAVNTTTGLLATVNTVHLGTGGSMAGILSPITFDNGPRYDALTLDDSTDSGNRTVNINTLSITGLSGGAINWTNASVNTITILGGTGTNAYTVNAPQAYLGTTLDTGSGADTVNVLAISAPLTVDTLSGGGGPNSSTVNVGNAGSLAGIGAALTIHNNPAYDTVIIDDSADGANRTVTVSAGGVTGLAPNPINFTNFSVSNLTINGGTGNNVYTITDTPVVFFGSMTLDTGSGTDTTNVLADSAPLTITVSTGSGNNDTVNVGNAGSVQGIQSQLMVVNHPGYTTLNVDDSTDAGARNVTLDDVAFLGTITGLAPAVISYYDVDMANVNVTTGTGADTVAVLDIGPIGIAGMLTLYNNSNTTVNVGNAGSVQGIQSPLMVVNHPGYTTLNVDDSADPTGQNVTLNDVANLATITGLAPAVISYYDTDVAAVNINGGSGGNVFDIEATSPYAPTTVNAGAGANIVRLTPIGQYLAPIGPLTLNGSGADILEFFDTANPASETYNFDNVPSNLTLTTVPVSVNFFGMASVYLETNGASTVNDPSGTVLVDVPPPSPPGGRSESSGGRFSDDPAQRDTTPVHDLPAGDFNAGSQVQMPVLVEKTPVPADQADLIDQLFSL